MADDSTNNQAAAPDLAGRGELRALNLADPKDMQLAHEAVRSWPRRWRALTEEVKTQMVRGLAQGMTIAQTMMDSPSVEVSAEGARIAAMASRVAVAMDKAEQTQELRLLDKMVPNAGDPTRHERAGPTVVNVQIVEVQQQQPKREVVAP